jgi:hypothetical protein
LIAFRKMALPRRWLADVIADILAHAAEGRRQLFLRAFCFRIASPAIRYVIT